MDAVGEGEGGVDWGEAPAMLPLPLQKPNCGGASAQPESCILDDDLESGNGGRGVWQGKLKENMFTCSQFLSCTMQKLTQH